MNRRESGYYRGMLHVTPSEVEQGVIIWEVPGPGFFVQFDEIPELVDALRKALPEPDRTV